MKWASLLFLFAFSLSTLQPSQSQAQGQLGGNGQQGGNQGQIGGNGNLEGGNSGAGGGSVANFTILMRLIETTVAPETWESLGGPSSMFPYAQGVYVDASGTIRDCDFMVKDNVADELKAMLGRPEEAAANQHDQWKNASPMRCVSLRRLLGRKKQLGPATPDSIDCLAGLSEIQYVFFDQDDIIIAGPVGGIESHQGWYRDRHTGRTAMRLDFFITCLASSLAGQPFGCTIDPTQQGLQNASQVAVGVKNHSIPIGKASDAMVKALGMQRIEVFGTAGDTPIGYVMVEADRHMKQLALGVHPMPRAAKNYLDVIEDLIDQGPPQDLLLRLWFASNPRSVRSDSDQTIFEITGSPIRLSGQNERALASGERGHIRHDPRTEIFVDDFNRNWNDIRSKYPIYGALESIYQSASIAELLRRKADSPDHLELIKSFANVDTTSTYLMPTPRQVESIAVLHTFQRNRKRHHIVIASGGVAVDSKLTLTSSITNYPALDSTPAPVETQPAVIQRWWWDR